MQTRYKLWTGLGACVLVGSVGTTPAAAASHAVPLQVSLASAQAGGEGGEGGGEGGAVPSQYTLFLTDEATPHYDAAPQIDAYVRHVQDSYGRARAALGKLDAAIAALLAAPDDATLAAARKAWIAARPSYLETEAFRFYDGPIDGPESGARPAGPESRINSWPLNEAVIDYVEGAADAGLVNALDVPLTRETVLQRDQVSDEADVTTGWHAIEFLLWGQDRDPAGPGARPVSDFAPGKPANERRRTYLKLLVEQLDADLAGLEKAWERKDADSYAAFFLKLPQTEALGRIFAGMATLAGIELASERLGVALDSGSQEDEHSCFSDTTRQDFVYDLRGIRAVWTAGADGTVNASLAALLRKRDAALAARVEKLFAEAEQRTAALADPFDRMLASPPESAARRDAEVALASYQELARGLRDAGRALGVLVIVPGV